MTVCGSFGAVFERTDALFESKPDAVICIEGRCASGKSFLAERLRDRYGCSVIHTDDFFLRPAQRTPRRYSEPGGNIDYERFRSEVSDRLLRGECVEYRPFECRTMTFGASMRAEAGRPRTVEGSYSMHPYFGNYFDMAIFMTVGSAEQLRRISVRNGQAALEAFTKKWIPMEESYLEAVKPWLRAELLADTTHFIFGTEQI